MKKLLLFALTLLLPLLMLALTLSSAAYAGPAGGGLDAQVELSAAAR